MSGQIECHGQSLLPGFDIISVELVGFLDSRESRVLSDRPRSVCVHRRVGTASEGVFAWNLKTAHSLFVSRFFSSAKDQPQSLFQAFDHW